MEALMARIEAFFDQATSTVSYLVWDAASRKAAIIDAVLDFDPATGRKGLRRNRTWRRRDVGVAPGIGVSFCDLSRKYDGRMNRPCARPARRLPKRKGRAVRGLLGYRRRLLTDGGPAPPRPSPWASGPAW